MFAGARNWRPDKLKRNHLLRFMGSAYVSVAAAAGSNAAEGDQQDQG